MKIPLLLEPLRHRDFRLLWAGQGVSILGNFVFGVGLGYREEEFEAFGVDYGTRGSRFEECLDVAIRLWTEDEVTHRGRHFTLTAASLLLKPVQKPHPPIWMAASGDPAVRRAARYGFAWLINPHASLANLVLWYERT